MFRIVFLVVNFPFVPRVSIVPSPHRTTSIGLPGADVSILSCYAVFTDETPKITIEHDRRRPSSMMIHCISDQTYLTIFPLSKYPNRELYVRAGNNTIMMKLVIHLLFMNSFLFPKLVVGERGYLTFEM